MTRVEDKHIDIDSVKVNGRYRKDVGDLEELKQSIADKNLLQPIVITKDRSLIAGQRRLLACRELGWQSIPVRIMGNLTEAHQALEAERDENTCRLAMKPSEMVALTSKLEAHEKERVAASRSEKARQAGVASGAKRRGEERAGKITARSHEGAADKAAETVGWSRNTYARAKEVVELAEVGDEIAQAALEEMDRTGKVNPAWRRITDTPTPPRVERIDIAKTRNRQYAEAKKKRLAKGIYGLEGTAQGFTEVDFRYVFAVTDQDELSEWDHILAQASRSISGLRKRLKEGKVTT